MHAGTITGRVLGGAALAALLLTGCGGDDDPSDAGTTTTTTTTTTEAPSSESTAGTAPAETEPPETEPAASEPAPTTTPAGVGCTGGENGPGAPPELAADQIADIDGDGRPEGAFIAVYGEDEPLFGIRFSTSGASVSTGIDPSAGPAPLIALPADVDGDGRVELIAGSTRGTELFGIQGCEIVPITGEDGEPYRFDYVTDAPGTGVGCIDGTLVGLDITSDDGTTVEWTRTPIEIEGTTARNGEVETGTYTHGQDDAAIDLLSQTTCGDLTVEADGVLLER